MRWGRSHDQLDSARGHRAPRLPQQCRFHHAGAFRGGDDPGEFVQDFLETSGAPPNPLSLSLAHVRTTSFHRRTTPAAVDLCATGPTAEHAGAVPRVVFVASHISLDAACAPTGSNRHASSVIAVSGISLYQVEGFIKDESRTGLRVEPTSRRGCHDQRSSPR